MQLYIKLQLIFKTIGYFINKFIINVVFNINKHKLIYQFNGFLNMTASIFSIILFPFTNIQIPNIFIFKDFQ